MTKIEWCTETWNPVTGCSHSGSPGCDNCYARRMAYRLKGRCGYPQVAPFSIVFHRSRLNLPFKWRKPRLIFVNSMGDLFHEEVPLRVIFEVFKVMKANSRHTFLVLTKRSRRLQEILMGEIPYIKNKTEFEDDCWPLDYLFQNVWFGVTVENQEVAYERIPDLMFTPDIKRFISVEPMLGPIDLRPYLDKRNFVNPIHWVICGAETGPGKRLMDLEWAYDLYDQCRMNDKPFFFKKDSTGRQADLPREFPKGL